MAAGIHTKAITEPSKYRHACSLINIFDHAVDSNQFTDSVSFHRTAWDDPMLFDGKIKTEPKLENNLIPASPFIVQVRSVWTHLPSVSEGAPPDTLDRQKMHCQLGEQPGNCGR